MTRVHITLSTGVTYVAGVDTADPDEAIVAVADAIDNGLTLEVRHREGSMTYRAGFNIDHLVSLVASIPPAV